MIKEKLEMTVGVVLIKNKIKQIIEVVLLEWLGLLFWLDCVL